MGGLPRTPTPPWGSAGSQGQGSLTTGLHDRDPARGAQLVRDPVRSPTCPPAAIKNQE